MKTPIFFQNRDRLAIALLLLIVLGFFLPILVQPNKFIWPSSGLGSDISYRHWPDLTEFAANLRVGRLPLWDPLVALGRPLAGDTAVLFTYPFNLLFLVFPPTFAFNAINAIHVFLAGLFTYLLIRIGFKESQPAALFGALAFAFAPKTISHLAGGHVGLVWGLTWAPAVLLGLKMSLNGNSYLYAALAGLALALPMPNHIQIPYYTGIISSAFWLWHLISLIRQQQLNTSNKSTEIRRVITIYGVWLLFFVLAASIVLLPLLEILPFNSRQDFSLEKANYLALPPFLLSTVFLTTDFQFPEWTMYLGTLPLLLGMVGLTNSTQNIRWFFAILIGFAFVYAVGTNTPLFGLAFKFIPGFKLLRVPTRLWFFAALAMALLSGFGMARLEDPNLFDRLLQNRSKLLRAALLYLVVACATLIGTRIALNTLNIFLIRQIMIILLTSLFVTLWLKNQIHTPVLQSILVVLLLAELVPMANDFIDIVDPREEFIISTPAFEYVSAQPGIFRTYSPTGDFPFGLAAGRGVEALEGRLAFQISHAVEAIRKATGCPKLEYETEIPPCLRDSGKSALPNPELLGRLNVKYVISSSRIDNPRFNLVFDGELAVYENLDWEPRVLLHGSGNMAILDRFPGDYTITATTDGEALLEIRETWLPGWKATNNGEPVAVVAVDDLFIGIPLDYGKHQVHVYYQPEGWRWGWPITLGTIIFLLVWTVAETRQCSFERKAKFDIRQD